MTYVIEQLHAYPAGDEVGQRVASCRGWDGSRRIRAGHSCELVGPQEETTGRLAQGLAKRSEPSHLKAAPSGKEHLGKGRVAKRAEGLELRSRWSMQVHGPEGKATDGKRWMVDASTTAATHGVKRLPYNPSTAALP